jgi:hypothetical protein
VYIAIGDFADMDHLLNFDEMVARPSLLMPQKTPVDEDAILPYFTNLVEALPIEFNATPFAMAHNIPFRELQYRIALLHIWPHSIKISPNQWYPYDIPNDTFCNSQILSHNGMSKPTKEDNGASLLAMENHLFDRLCDAMKDQSQNMYEFMNHALEDRQVLHLSNYCDNTQPLYNSFTATINIPPHLNETTI